MERVGTTTYSAVGTNTSYEYGTYSEGDYDLSSVSYSSSSSSTASMTHAITSETDEGTSQAGTVNRGSNGYVAGANLSDGYQRDIESDADTSDRYTSQEVQTSSFSVQTSSQLRQGTYSHGSYSYSCLAYDRQSDSSQTISSTSSYSSTATIHAISTDTEWVETLDKWNNVYRATGYVLTSWFAEYTQTLGIAGSDSSTITNHESYASSIRGTSSGYDFSFSLISSTYDSFTTTSYSSSSSASSTYTGEHSTSLTGVLGSITGTDASSVSSTGTNTLHYKKQHLGLMVNGLATIVYDKITVDTSNSVTNSTSQSTTLEGHHADFDVYQYDYSGATVTGSQSSHDYKEVAFDSTATNPWSLSSYNSIQTVSNGFSYDDQSVFDMWHHVTASDPYSQTTWLYTHHRERSDTGSSAVTLAFHTRGHSVADGAGGYSFVFDHYSVGISSSEGSTYSYSGFVSLLDQVSYTAPVGPYADSSNYSSFEWNKSRVRSGSESESIAGSTSGATFQYSSYSKNNTRDDDTEFDGYRYFDSTGPLGSGWSHQTLIYDENLEYDYTASTSDYSVSINYTAPWTLSQSSSFLGTSTTSGTITKNEDDTGANGLEVPAPVEVVGNFDGAKAGEYYGLGAGVVAGNDDKEEAAASAQAFLKQVGQPKEPRIPIKPIRPIEPGKPSPPPNDMNGPPSSFKWKAYEESLNRYFSNYDSIMSEYQKRLRRYNSDLKDYEQELATYPQRLREYQEYIRLLDLARSSEDPQLWDQRKKEEMEAFRQTIIEGKKKTIELGLALIGFGGVAAASIPGAVVGAGFSFFSELGKWKQGGRPSPLNVALGAVEGAAAVKILSGIFAGVNRLIRGTTVLGHYPAYTELAEQLGARRFSIPSTVWNKMSEAERWAANTKFLDRVIARGDIIILATRADLAKPGSYFARELAYMIRMGYKISKDGFQLIPPGVR